LDKVDSEVEPAVRAAVAGSVVEASAAVVEADPVDVRARSASSTTSWLTYRV
jgi:hypothetical protein